MKLSKRAQLRAQYIEGWNSMDLEKLLTSITEDFLFDDPTDPEAVTKEMLPAYLPRWPEKAGALGARFDFDIVDKVVQDRDGILLEWYWWRLTGTDVEGSAVIKTSDEGVIFEKLTYFKTPWPLLR
jgi:hypothetical protein